MTRLFLFLLFMSCVVLPVAATAQTTGGVPGPGVREGDRTVQLRTALGTFDDRPDRVEARLHYQQAISDALRWRIVIQGNDFETGDFEPVFLQGELQWEFDEDPDWTKALRFDARLGEDDDGPDKLGIVSLNQFALSDQTYLRALAFANVRLGPRRTSGVAGDLRFQLGHNISPKTTLVMESFVGLGRGESFGKFSRTRINAGPGVSYNLGNDVSVFGSVLFGLNDATADTDLRLWLTKSFG